MEQVREVLISLMAQAGTPANAVLAPELMKRLGERITAAFPRLMQAGLVVRLARGSYAITPAGREAASRWPERVDSEFFKAIAGDAPAGRKECPGGPEAAPSGRAASTVAGGQPSVPRPGWPFRRDGAAGRPDRDTIRAALLAVMGRLSMAASSEIRRALDALLAEAEMPPETVGTPEFGAWLNGKISLCMADLRQTGILDRLSRGVYRLTDAGRGLWARMPERISLETLSEISSRAPESRTTEGPAQGGRAPEGPAREGILPDAHGLRPGWPFLGTESGRLPEISRIAAAILALAEPAPGTRAHEFRQTIAGLIAQAGMPPPSALPLRFDTWLSSRIHLSLRRLTKAGILKHEHFGTYSLTPMGERIRAERRELVSDRILSGLAAGTLKLPEVAASRPPVPASASPGISDGDGAVGGEAFGPEAAGCPATGTKATGPKAAGGGGAADGLAADGLAAGNRTAGREEAGGDAAGNRTAGREGTGGEAAGYGTSLFEAADGKSGDGGKPERPGWPFLSWTPGGGLPDQDRIAAAALALAGRRPVAETRPIALAVAELLIAAGMPPAEARSPGFVRMLSAAVRDSLRKFIKRGLMERLTSGLYRLTATGRAVAALAPERADSRVLRAAGRGELPVAPVELPAPPWPGWPFVPGGAKPPTLSRLTSAILYVLGAFGEADTKQTLRALTDMLEQAGMPRGDARPPDFPGWLAKRVSLMFASLKKAGLARNVGHGAFGITDIGRAALAEMPEQLTNSLLSSTAVAFRDGSSGAGKPDPWPGWPFKPGESMAVAIRGAAMTTAALAILELRPGAAEAQIIQGAASRLVLANKGAGRTVRTGLAGQVGLALGPVLERLVRNGLIIRSGEGYRLTIAGKGTLASRRMNPACAKGAGLSPEDPWKAVERALRLAREIELNRLSRHVRLLDGKRLEALAARLAVTLAPPSAGPPRFRVKAGSPVGREDLTALAAVSAAQGAAEAFLFAPFGADAVAAAHDKSAAGGMTVLDASAIAELMYESGTGLETFRNVALRTPDPDFFARLES
jgi:restriction endonuclease Mrr